MAEKEHNFPMYLVIAALGSGGSHFATKMAVEPVNSTTIDNCRVFVDHAVRHCETDCAISKIK